MKFIKPNNHNIGRLAGISLISILGALPLGASSCNGGGGRGGGTPGDTTKPTITKVEYTPKNPVLGQPFQGKVSGSDDKNPMSDLEAELTIDTDRDGDFSDETPISQKDISNAITLNISGPDGKYSYRITLKDTAGNSAETTGTFYTNPHSSVFADGSISDAPSFPPITGGYKGEVLDYLITYAVNQQAQGAELDLKKLRDELAKSGTEKLAGFDFTSGTLEVLVNNTASTGFDDSDGDGNGDYAGKYPLPQTTAAVVNAYLTGKFATAADIVDYSGIFRMQTSPDNAAVSSYGLPAANPELTDMFTGVGITLPGTPNVIGPSLGTQYIQIEHGGVNPRVTILVIDPTQQEESDVAVYNTDPNKPASVKVIPVKSGQVTRAELDQYFHN